MRVTRYDDPAAFSEAVKPLLLRREAENNLILGLVLLMASGRRHAGALMCAVGDDRAGPVAAAVMTPTHPLVLTHAPRRAIDALVAELSRGDVRPVSVTGPAESVEVFADAWVAANGVRRRPGWSLGGFKLTAVTPPARPARGTFRAARENDSDGLVRWAEDFFVETRHVGKDDPRQVVEERIREGRLFVWCDPGDRPACMAGWAGATPNGVRVNFVYTPPGNRGRGYATSCVAALSRHLLDSGGRFCFLFTNLENRTANKIYAEIGYRHVGDYRDVRFESRGGLGDD